MNQSMTPEQLQLLIAGYVLNDLNDEEATVMEGLLEDAEILQAIDQMQFALEAAYAPEEIQPSPQLRTGIMNAATGTQALDRVDLQGAQSINPDLASLSIGALPRWLKVLGTLAALLIAGLSLSNYVMWRSLRIQQARLQSEPLVFSLQPTANVAPTSKVVLQVNPDTLRGTLKIDNLPPLEPGKVYVLWTVLAPDAPFTTDPKNAILTEVFTVSPEGNQTQPIILPSAFQAPELVKAVAITVEDAAAPQRHQSAPILIQKL